MKQGYDTSQFEKDLNSLDVTLETKQIEQFLIYYEMLAEWNQKMNLTAITEYDEVLKKHFIDSISLVKAIDLKKKGLRMIDVGTGAGFPGLVLKICFPHVSVTLLDSLNKRVNFLNTVITELGLENISAIHGRAENVSREKKYREGFDLCVSRAVARLNILTELCTPFVRVGGSFVSYKSSDYGDEVIESERSLELLGCRLNHVDELEIFNNRRSFIFIDKVLPVSEKYPRREGIPAKKPL
jgi:16S rRNA (guanine527-N7)-methyltransferase